MKKSLTLIALTSFVGAFALSSIAMAEGMAPETMTCADFAKMDKEAMMKATAEMYKAAHEGKDMDMAMGEELMQKTMSGCDGHGEMMAIDAMNK